MSRPTFASQDEAGVWVAFAAGSLAAVAGITVPDGDKTSAKRAAEIAAKHADELLLEFRERCSR